MNSILCTICMRGGSQGVKNKNLKLINGKPLMYYTIRQAKKSNIFDNVVISTDSKKIQKLSKTLGGEGWFLRSKKLSSNTAQKISVIKDVLIRAENFYKKNFDVIVDLDVTSPLRDSKDIIRAYKSFKKKNADMLISGCKSRRNPYFNMIEKKGNKLFTVKQLKKKIFRRQDAPKTFDLNASIYIWKKKALLNFKSFYKGKTIFYEMPEFKSWDIDSKFDFEIVKYLLSKKLSGSIRNKI